MSCSRCGVRRRRALKGANRGALAIAIMDPYGHEAELEALAKAGVSAFAMELMPRITRAQVMDVLVLPGEPGGLPGGGGCGRRVRPGLPDDDDGGGHGAGGAGLRHGRGGRGPAGGGHGAPSSGCCRLGHRRAPGGEGAGGEPRRQVHRRGGRGVQAGGDGGRLRQADVGGVPGQAGGAGGLAYRQAGCRHHHGADPRPPGAEAGLGARWWRR